ncbi:MAG: hypothetical protein H6Q99_306 [Proteobacteria bacterium]|nr:hypothetical protein [Pseudomonadota bacterium]
MNAPVKSKTPISAAEALRIKASHFRIYADDSEAMISRHPVGSSRKKLKATADLWRNAAEELEAAADAIAKEDV